MYKLADMTLFKTKAEKCAKEIIDYLLKKEMMDDTFIYVNGKRYGTYDGEKGYHYGTNSWEDVYVEENKVGRNYCEYAGDILSISSEGFLYDAMNYGFEWNTKIPEELDAILKKYGMYLEACTSWFWTACEL
jgi:hypothetical protein